MWSSIAIGVALLVSARSISYTTSYNQDDALIALYYAYSAYCNHTELRAWNCLFCQQVSGFEVANNGAGVVIDEGIVLDNEMQAFIGYDPDYQRIVLSFRGSKNVENWISNFDFDLVNYEYATGEVHSGFYGQWQELLDAGFQYQIQSMLETYPGSDILATGHSLGGALAYIAALELKANTATWGAYSKGAVHVVSFGAPRWCDQDLATYFNGVIDSNYRIVNEADIVPSLPYEIMGFFHTAIEIHYTSTSPLTYDECDGEGEDVNCEYIGYSIDDHLYYFGIYEDCPNTNFTASLETTSSTLTLTSTAVRNVGNSSAMEEQIIYRWREGIDNISKISLSIAVAVGWLLAFVCSCCFFKARHDLKKAQNTRPYVQMDDRV